VVACGGGTLLSFLSAAHAAICYQIQDELSPDRGLFTLDLCCDPDVALFRRLHLLQWFGMGSRHHGLSRRFDSLWTRVFTRARLERVFLPISIALLLFTLGFRNPIFRETIRYSIQGVALAPILYYVVHAPKSWVGRILNTRLLAFVGTLSYALYLLHATVLIELDHAMSSQWLAGILSLFISVLLAYIVHIAIEKPTDAMRKKFRHTSDESQPHPVAKAGAAVVLP
jgi:peptidoglycan/LPS O-acetylase OafA/YrhL